MAGRRAPRGSLTRARSQHFLRTARAAELVRNAGVRPTDVAVDLGAGSGRLTAQLARVARRVIAVELDPRLAAGLRGRWSNVEVIEADAATVALPREPFRVVSNLPFSRTNDLLHHLLDDPATPLVRADVVVQWGVARKRGIPWPSTMNSVVWGATYEVGIGRRLPRARSSHRRASTPACWCSGAGTRRWWRPPCRATARSSPAASATGYARWHRRAARGGERARPRPAPVGPALEPSA